MHVQKNRVHRQRCHRARTTTHLAVLACLLHGLLATTAVNAQQWDTEKDHPGDPAYHQPDYPLAFVASKIVQVPNPTPNFPNGEIGYYHIGTGVSSANNPDAGSHLFILRTDGTVDKLFPRDIHLPMVNVDTVAELSLGAALEPNTSEDGRRIYFSYVHNATDETTHEGGLANLPRRGADIYAIDLDLLLSNPTVDLDLLPAHRLTFSGTLATPLNEYAMNQDAVDDAGVNDWGTFNMHAVEMRTKEGLKLVYASDKRRLLNSNTTFSPGVANHNFNLHAADLVETPTGPELQNSRQLHYYTTTSALSPTPLREGIAFSYQASTAEPRQWHIQSSDSVGRWSPLIGYGVNQELVHLGSLCVSNEGGTDSDGVDYRPGDYYIVSRYYNQNNEGFGNLHRISLNPNTLGRNYYDDLVPGVGKKPIQVGDKIITDRTSSNDVVSTWDSTAGQYVGKFTSPRCGRPDELYMSYSPTSANGKDFDNMGHKHIYHAQITYRDSLASFEPLDDQKTVVNDTSGEYNLVWPTPIIDWLERTGSDAEQSFSDTVVDPDTTIKAGFPHALVGSGSLDNTDRRPFDCWLTNDTEPFDPNIHWKGNFNIHVTRNQDGLSRVKNPNDFCAPIDHTDVLGIAIQITSNKLNADFGFAPGYETTGVSARKEISKLLGVIDVRNQLNEQNLPDTSFEALIPSRVPFEFHLLDSTYGLRLADVRSWHSLQPRETRTNCGGCHQHEYNAPFVDFQGTVADTNPAEDLVAATPYLDYQLDCTPQYVNNPGTAALRLPDWDDLWPEFDTACSSCHDENSSPPAGDDGTGAFQYNRTDPDTAYDNLSSNFLAWPENGALSSPAFWAARGERTDGRDNSIYSGTAFYSVHHERQMAGTPLVTLCGTTQADASFVYRFGQWIDNHMPKTNNHTYDYDYDRFHPTLDFAISNSSCAPNKLRIGYWDDSGSIDKLEIFIDDNFHGDYQSPGDNLDNGKKIYSIIGTAFNDDSPVRVIATDAAGNRQMYTKTIRELKDECVVGPIREPIDPLPVP